MSGSHYGKFYQPESASKQKTAAYTAFNQKVTEAVNNYLAQNKDRIEKDLRLKGLNEEEISRVIEKTKRDTELQLIKKFKEELELAKAEQSQQSAAEPDSAPTAT